MTIKGVSPTDIEIGRGHTSGTIGAGAALARYKSTGFDARDDVPFFSQPCELNPMQVGVESHKDCSVGMSVVFVCGYKVSLVLRTSLEG